MPRIHFSPPHMSGFELELVNDAFATNWIARLEPHVGSLGVRVRLDAVIEVLAADRPGVLREALVAHSTNHGHSAGRSGAPCQSAVSGRAWMLAANGMVSRPV